MKMSPIKGVHLLPMCVGESKHLKLLPKPKVVLGKIASLKGTLPLTIVGRTKPTSKVNI